MSSTITSSFDAADRLTTSGYVYDELGRTKTAPAAHTSNPTDSALAVGYHANDMVATLSQSVTEDGVTATKAQDFTLDVAGRLSVTKNLTDTVSLVESTNHYDGGDDSPAWTETKTRPDATTAWATAWNRNVASLGGDLGIIQGSDGTSKIQLGNLHDDVTATVTVGGTGIDSYTEYTEYGLPRDAANTPERYGWLGTKQRDAGTISGLTLMGARLYNPTTGRFLSRDPVAGGNDNTYTYPADPINKFDLAGQWWSSKKWRRGFWGGVGFFSARGWVEASRSARHGHFGGLAQQSGWTVVGIASKRASKRWGSFGRHSRITRVARVAKFGLRNGARAFGWPVTAGATMLDYTHRNYLRHKKPDRVWAPRRFQRTRGW